METEKEIEKYLRDEVKKANGLCFKFISPGYTGVPDRLILLKPLIFFVEVKGPNGVISGKQARTIGRIRSQGTPVFIISSKREVDKLMESYHAELQRLTSVPEKSDSGIIQPRSRILVP